MADDGIKISISPSTITGGGKRLAEMSPSFVSDKFGGVRLAAPGAQSGTDQRAQITAERENTAALRAVSADIRSLRNLRKLTQPGTSESAALQGRIDQLFQRRDELLAGGAFGKSELGRDDVAKGEGAAPMPGAAQRSAIDVAQRLAVAGRSLLGAVAQTFQGNPAGAFRSAVGGVNAFAGGGSYLSGGGGAAAAGPAPQRMHPQARARRRRAGSILAPALLARRRGRRASHRRLPAAYKHPEHRRGPHFLAARDLRRPPLLPR